LECGGEAAVLNKSKNEGGRTRGVLRNAPQSCLAKTWLKSPEDHWICCESLNRETAFPMVILNPANDSLDAPADFNWIVCEHEAVYKPRQAEESILYGVVAENLETFLAWQEQRERTVP
jgi:hypothetical protein